jgi:hypothetical protein
MDIIAQLIMLSLWVIGGSLAGVLVLSWLFPEGEVEE